jgi:hypothetical protein
MAITIGQRAKWRSPIGQAMLACDWSEFFQRNDPVPGGRDKVDGAPDAVLHLQQLLELFYPLHGVVGVGRGLGHLTQCACTSNSF